MQEKLRKPFSVKDLEFRVGSTNKDKTKGIALVYITARAVMDRLDEVFGVAGWDCSFKEITKGGLICTIEHVQYEDTGNFRSTSKADVSEFSDIESIKGGASGAFKRAGVMYGIGRYLYDIPNVWVELKDGKYFVAKHDELCNLVLPDWAILPEELAQVRGKKVSSTPPKTETKKVEPPAAGEEKKEEPTHNELTLDSANNTVCTTGYAKGKKMIDLTQKQLEYLTAKGSEIEKVAADMVLQNKED